MLMIFRYINRFKVALGLILISWIFYSITGSEVYSFTHDSQNLLIPLWENPAFDASLLHAHHYLSFAFVWAVSKLCALFVVRPYPELIIEAYQVINSLFSALTVGAVYALLKQRFQCSQVFSILMAIFTGLTYGVWVYSTAIEIYAVPMALSTWLLYAMLAKTFTWPRVLTLILLMVTLFFFYTSLALMGLWVLVNLLIGLKKSAGSRTELWQKVGVFVGVSAGLGLAGSLLIFYWVGLGSLPEVLAWLGAKAGVSYPVIDVLTPVRILMGFGRAFFGFVFVLASPVLSDLVSQWVPGHNLVNETFLVRQLPAWAAHGLLALSVVMTAMFAWVVAKAWPILKKEAKAKGRLYGSLLSLWLLYFLVAIFTEMSNADHYLFLIPWTCVLLGVAVDRALPTCKENFAIAMSIGMVLVVFFGAVHWLCTDLNDYYYQRNRYLRFLAGETGLVVLDTTWQNRQYFHRYARVMYLVPMLEKNEAHWHYYANALLTRFARTYRPIIVPESVIAPDKYTRNRYEIDLAKWTTVWPYVPAKKLQNPVTKESVYVFQRRPGRIEN